MKETLCFDPNEESKQ